MADHHLIASDRVEGTPVRRSDGDEIGHIRRVMIDKQSGKVAYAVMGVQSGIFGTESRVFTLPWGVLHYDTGLEAYKLDMTDEQLRDAPHDSPSSAEKQHDASFSREWEEHVHKYYNATPYWGRSDPMSTGR